MDLFSFPRGQNDGGVVVVALPLRGRSTVALWAFIPCQTMTGLPLGLCISISDPKKNKSIRSLYGVTGRVLELKSHSNKVYWTTLGSLFFLSLALLIGLMQMAVGKNFPWRNTGIKMGQIDTIQSSYVLSKYLGSGLSSPPRSS